LAKLGLVDAVAVRVFSLRLIQCERAADPLATISKIEPNARKIGAQSHFISAARFALGQSILPLGMGR
jgi:hypothetical protein